MKESRYLIDLAVETYCEEHTTAEDNTLVELTRETNLKMLMPRMLSGKVQGRFLTILVEILRPQNILELGTFTGYSAICLAKGLSEDGKLITIDKNPEIEDFARRYFKKSGLEDKILFFVGDALKIVPKLEYDFDMVYLDADKENLAEYYQVIIEKLKPGALILADNILWDGKVVDNTQNDKITCGIRTFNDLVQSDERVENVLLPLRDGLMLIRKR